MLSVAAMEVNSTKEVFGIVSLPFAVGLASISLCGLFGNLSIILAVFRSTKLRNPCAYLVGILAFADAGTNVFFGLIVSFRTIHFKIPFELVNCSGNGFPKAILYSFQTSFTTTGQLCPPVAGDVSISD